MEDLPNQAGVSTEIEVREGRISKEREHSNNGKRGNISMASYYSRIGGPPSCSSNDSECWKGVWRLSSPHPRRIEYLLFITGLRLECQVCSSPFVSVVESTVTRERRRDERDERERDGEKRKKREGERRNVFHVRSREEWIVRVIRLSNQVVLSIKKLKLQC